MLALAQVDTQREALRQQSVGSIIDAANLMSEIDRREQSGALDIEQANRLRRLAPYDTRLAEAELEKSAADTANLRARTRTEEEQREYDTRLKEIQSRGYDIPIPGIGRGTLAGKDLGTYINTLADYQAAISGQQSAAAIRAATASATAQHREQMQANAEERIQQARERLAESGRKSAEQRISEAKEVESILVAPELAKHTAESAGPLTDAFNAISDSPYVYIHLPAETRPGPGILGERFRDRPAENRKIDLPVRPSVEGVAPRRYTAREIYLMALAARKDVKTFLEEDFYPKAYGKKAPWQQ